MVKNIAFLMGLLIFSNTLFAQNEVNFPRALQLFESAKIVYEENTEARNYTLALGPYEKIANLWQPEKKQRLAGALLRQTHEVSRDYSERDVYEHYVAQLPEKSEVLYRCESFNCGASNNWANVHFDIKQLYGLDRDQFYQVNHLDSGEYVTIYVVRRGNRRIFAQIEIIKPVKQ